MLLDIFVISLDHNKIKVDLCPDFTRFHLASRAAGTHHFDQVAAAIVITCNVLAFERENFRLGTSFVVSPRT